MIHTVREQVKNITIDRDIVIALGEQSHNLPFEQNDENMMDFITYYLQSARLLDAFDRATSSIANMTLLDISKMPKYHYPQRLQLIADALPRQYVDYIQQRENEYNLYMADPTISGALNALYGYKYNLEGELTGLTTIMKQAGEVQNNPTELDHLKEKKLRYTENIQKVCKEMLAIAQSAQMVKVVNDMFEGIEKLTNDLMPIPHNLELSFLY